MKVGFQLSIIFLAYLQNIFNKASFIILKQEEQQHKWNIRRLMEMFQELAVVLKKACVFGSDKNSWMFLIILFLEKGRRYGSTSTQPGQKKLGNCLWNKGLIVDLSCFQERAQEGSAACPKGFTWPGHMDDQHFGGLAYWSMNFRYFSS